MINVGDKIEFDYLKGGNVVEHKTIKVCEIDSRHVGGVYDDGNYRLFLRDRMSCINVLSAPTVDEIKERVARKLVDIVTQDTTMFVDEMTELILEPSTRDSFSDLFGENFVSSLDFLREYGKMSDVLNYLEN